MPTEFDQSVDALEQRVGELQQEIARLRARRPAEPVRNYEFAEPGGRGVRLSTLFDGRDRLVLVHNMGQSCPYCTLWADGFVGLLPHLTSRGAFVVSSPDPPEEQARFAAARGWPFRMVSVSDPDFLGDMGFLDAGGGLLPGVSVFARQADGAVVRASRAEFFPGDSFCAAWHLFDLFPEGVAEWEPRYEYAPRSACCGGPGGKRAIIEKSAEPAHG